MSISRLPPDLWLDQVFPFLSLGQAQGCAEVCKEWNQLCSSEPFAADQMQRLFPGQSSALPMAEYQKITRIFANFAAGRYGYSAVGGLPAGAEPRDSSLHYDLSLGPFRLSLREGDSPGNIYVIIEGQRGIASRVRIWGDGNPDNRWALRSPLVSTPEAGVFVGEIHYRGVSDLDDAYRRLDFSLTHEEILFGLADIFLRYPRHDDAFSDVVNSFDQQDKNAIYWKLWFLNREEVGNRYPDYGTKAFENLPYIKYYFNPNHRTYFVSNRDRAEAILHHSMCLIARRYAAPHGDALAEPLFARLPAALRNPVYGELYAIRRPQQNEDVWNYGELAFHGRLGTVTNADRRAAILRFVDKGQKVL